MLVTLPAADKQYQYVADVDGECQRQILQEYRAEKKARIRLDDVEDIRDSSKAVRLLELCETAQETLVSGSLEESEE